MNSGPSARLETQEASIQAEPRGFRPGVAADVMLAALHLSVALARVNAARPSLPRATFRTRDVARGCPLSYRIHPASVASTMTA
jgi:hypothetical protein